MRKIFLSVAVLLFTHGAVNGETSDVPSEYDESVPAYELEEEYEEWEVRMEMERAKRQELRNYRDALSMPVQYDVGVSWRGMPPFVNPANPSLSVSRLRFGPLLDLGVGMELGTVDDFDTKIDRLVDDFDDLEERAEEWEELNWEDIWDDAANLQEFFDEVDETLDDLEGYLIDLDDFSADANSLIEDISEEAYAKLGVKAAFPLTPFAVRSDTLGGTFSISGGAALEARMIVESSGEAFPQLPEELRSDLDGDGIGDYTRFEFDESGEDDSPVIIYTGDDGKEHEIGIEPTDEAGVAVQGGVIRHAGLGFSRPLRHHDNLHVNAGVNLNYYYVSLVRAGVLFDYEDDDLEDVAEDEFDNRKTSQDFGVDLGITAVTDYFSLGGVIRNINEPSFKYPDTSDSRFFQKNPQARRGGDEWTMERQYTLQGAVHTACRNWILSASGDLNSVTDSTGDQYQWLAAMGSYEPKTFLNWVPTPRLGVRHNLKGEELTYLSAGLSFFRIIHIDASTTLDRTSFDGTKYPRGAELKLSAGWRF